MAGSLIIRRSALYHYHLESGAEMVEEHGWQRPEYYTAVEDEVQAIREGVGLRDASAVTKFDVKGKDTLSVLVRMLALNADPQMEMVGQVVPVSSETLAGDSGRDGLLCCLTRDHVMLITAPGTAGAVAQLLSASQEPLPDESCIHMTDVTSSFTAVQIIGPQGYDLLRKLTALDLNPTAFSNLRCAQGDIAKVHALVLRADVKTQLAYEVYCRREFGEYLWQTLRDAGQEFGVVPFGVAAVRQL